MNGTTLLSKKHFFVGLAQQASSPGRPDHPPHPTRFSGGVCELERETGVPFWQIPVPGSVHLGATDRLEFPVVESLNGQESIM